MELTATELRELLEYDPITGTFTWLQRPIRPGLGFADNSWNTKYAGQPAGWMHRDGYRVITLGSSKRREYAHRLAWLFVYGEWPPGMIDHKNGNPDDNRIDNLRLCTHSQNACNAKMFSHNTSGVRGVSFRPASGKYYAYIKQGRRMRSLGFYDTLEEAAAVRAKAERELFGEFRTSRP